MMIEKKDLTNMMHEACLTYESGFLQFADISESQDIVWILGKSYNPSKSCLQLKYEIISRLWFTYKKGFPPIKGDECLNTDTGWGCMIRTGQMMLAEAMIRNIFNLGPTTHNLTFRQTSPPEPILPNPKSPVLGPEERVTLAEGYTEAEELKIRISDEGKELNGQICTSPNGTLLNTAKRYIMESWYFFKNGHTNRTMIQDSLKLVTKQPANRAVDPSQEALFYDPTASNSAQREINLALFSLQTAHVLKHFLDDPACTYSIHNISTSAASLLDNSGPGKWFGPNSVSQAIKFLTKQDTTNDIRFHVAMDNVVILADIYKLFEQETKAGQAKLLETKADPSLVLVVPLRLGLSEIIPAYFDAIKAFFRMRQCIGILGGKPKHASWYIGYTGDDLIYLDPHTVQKSLPLDLYQNLASQITTPDNCPNFGESLQGEAKISGKDKELLLEELVPHIASYHCSHPSRMSFSHLDPSLSLAFYCNDRTDFDCLCNDIRENLMRPFSCPMFELLNQTPPIWKSENASSKTASTSVSPLTGGEFLNIEMDDFEVIE